VLLEKNLPENQLSYFQRLYEKKLLWRRAFNKENSLDQHCTGVVENINRQLKEHVGLKCSLTEYLYRTINFSGSFNDKSLIDSKEKLQFDTYFSHLLYNPYVTIVRDTISHYTLRKLVLNIMKSMSWTSDKKIFLF